MTMVELLDRGCRLQRHQADAVEWLEDHPKALLAHDTGLGKTVTAIAHVSQVIDSATRDGRLPGLVLWVTDANLLSQTEAEFARFAPKVKVLSCTDRLYRSQTPRSRREFAERFGPAGPHVLLFTYGLAMAGKAGATILRRFGPRFGKLDPPELVVCDEIQAVKGAGKRFAGLLEMSKHSPRVLVMTATPMQNNVTELWPVLRMMQVPGLLPREPFGARYATWDAGGEVRLPNGRVQEIQPKPVGLREDTLPELHDLLGRHMHRVTVRDSDAHLPEWDSAAGPRWIGLSHAQRAAYEASGAGGAGYVRRDGASRAYGGESALVDACLRLVGPSGEFGHEPKVVAYCETLDAVEVLCGKLEAAGIGYRCIQGDTKPKDRDVILAEFRDDPGVRVLVGSRVLETGLNLQHARVLISLDCSDNPKRERQREGRIRRIGSPHQSVTHVTLLPDTWQARKRWGRITSKESDVERVLDRQPVGV